MKKRRSAHLKEFYDVMTKIVTMLVSRPFCNGQWIDELHGAAHHLAIQSQLNKNRFTRIPQPVKSRRVQDNQQSPT